MNKLTYHFVFCPKYRRPVFNDQNARKMLGAVFGAICEQNRWQVRAFQIMPDHLHLMLTLPSTAPISFVVQKLKGASSRELRHHLPWLKGYLVGHLWARRYFCESLGEADEKTIERYILNQEKEWRRKFGKPAFEKPIEVRQKPQRAL